MAGEAQDPKTALVEALARELWSGTTEEYATAHIIADRIEALIDARIEALTGAVP